LLDLDPWEGYRVPLISVVTSKKDAYPTRLDMPWPELVQDLVDAARVRRCTCTVANCLTRDCAEKDGMGWCPCTFVDDHRLKTGVEQVTVLVVDIDHQQPGNYTAKLEAAGVSHVVHSTHSHRDGDWCLRVVVQLSRPVTPAEWPRFRAAALARFGLPGDEATKDASRLFFLPSAPSDGPIVGYEEPGHPLDVDEILGAPAVAGLAPTPAPKPVPAAVTSGVLNPRTGVADMDWLKSTLKRLKDPESQALANLMLAGKPLAKEGGRDAALQRLAGIMAFSLPTSTPIEAQLELARLSIMGLPGEPPAGCSDWMGAFEEKLLRALADRAVSDVKKAAFKEEIQKRYRKQAAATGTPTVLDERCEPEDDPTAPYTPQQIARWASEQRCDPSEFFLRWIISAGKAFWVFSEGRYMPPIARDDLDVSLLRDLSRAPDVTLFYQKKEDGNLVYVGIKNILRDYSTVARHVEASLSLQKSYYDAATQTFHEAVCPMRPLEPVENPQIHKWLEMIGGDQSDLLLDWVSTYMNLARQTCAIYLHSGPGTGKCLGKGTPVLMFDGRILPVESVQEGDLLMGPDSTPRKVLSTTVGRGPLYRIEPRRGNAWVCNEPHVLTLVHSGGKHADEVIDIPLDRYLNLPSKKEQERLKLFATGVNFPPAAPLPLDPYFFGVWLGDGEKWIMPQGLRGVSVCKPDEEIRQVCEQTAADYGLVVVKNDSNGTRCTSWKLVLPDGQKGPTHPNPLTVKMRAMLGDSLTIPPAYLTASRKDRAAFLAGWIDTDGYADVAGVEIAQKRVDWAEAITFVARSLGFHVSVADKVVNGVVYQRLLLSGDFSEIPIRIARKRPRARKINKDPLRTGFGVSAIGDGDYYGFMLDGDGRFLLGDFTVTHNTLLSQGLAKLWTTGGPSELDSVVGGFNSVLTQCPLVVADEALPKDSKGITTVLRRLIGTTTRNLNRKFMATCNLRGSVRLMICANNDRLLETGEELTNADLAAVAGRFLFLDTSKADVSERIRNYLLDEITPTVVNDEWLDGDGIAKHALWLAKTRVVNSTGRFLVEGRQTEFHRGLVTASGVTSSIAEFLTKWISHPGRGYADNDLVQVGNGKIWVATEIFGRSNWENLVPSMPLPSATRVGRSLNNLSEGSVRATAGKRQLTYHRVQPGLLISWARKNNVGDIDYIEQRLASDNKVVLAWDKRVDAATP
jgi:hypothetical protein